MREKSYLSYQYQLSSLSGALQNPQSLPLSCSGFGTYTYLLSYVASNHCPGTMNVALSFLLDTPATCTISFLGTHILMGPLGLVLAGIFFFKLWLLKPPNSALF